MGIVKEREKHNKIYYIKKNLKKKERVCVTFPKAHD